MSQNDIYKILSKINLNCLDISGSQLNNTDTIIQNEYNAKQSQHWKFVKTQNDCYKIVSDLNGKCIDLPQYTFENGISLQQWDLLEDINQEWFIHKISDKYFHIISRGNKKSFDLPTQNIGDALTVWDSHLGNNQQWILEPVKTIEPKYIHDYKENSEKLQKNRHILMFEDFIKEKELKEVKINWLTKNTGIFTDIRDGNKYKVVKIGNQIWFAENLKYRLKEGCWIYNNQSANIDKFGCLYNWETASNQGNLPIGWSLPNAEDWLELIDFYGGMKLSGKKFQVGTSEFENIFSGYMETDGTFLHVGNRSYYWSITEYANDRTHVLRPSFYNGHDNTHWHWGDKRHGFSIRCILK